MFNKILSGIIFGFCMQVLNDSEFINNQNVKMKRNMAFQNFLIIINKFKGGIL